MNSHINKYGYVKMQLNRFYLNQKKIIRRTYTKFNLWNKSFKLKNNLQSYNIFYLLIFYITHISLVIKDIKRFVK